MIMTRLSITFLLVSDFVLTELIGLFSSFLLPVIYILYRTKVSKKTIEFNVQNSQSSVNRLCVVRSTGAFSLTGASGAPHRAGTAVRNGNDVDVIYYLNTTTYL